jgi:DNA-binding XRE family transcriptional regulator
MKFNYSKLLGRIKECGYTQEKLAEAIQINKGTLNQKLKNKSHFTTLEMSKMCKALSISPAEIGEYFFVE